MIESKSRLANKSMKYLSSACFILLFAFTSFAQRELGARPTETGGPLAFEQAVYDVLNYDISINADPKTKSITGTKDAFK